VLPSDTFLHRHGFEALDPRLAAHLAGTERMEVAYAYDNGHVLLAATHHHHDGWTYYVARPVPEGAAAPDASGIAGVFTRVATYLLRESTVHPQWYSVPTVLPDFWNRANEASRKLPYPHRLDDGLEQQLFEQSLLDVFEQVERGRLEELTRLRVHSH
jgi:hypothetical protein